MKNFSLLFFFYVNRVRGMVDEMRGRADAEQNSNQVFLGHENLYIQDGNYLWLDF